MVTRSSRGFSALPQKRRFSTVSRARGSNCPGVPKRRTVASSRCWKPKTCASEPSARAMARTARKAVDQLAPAPPRRVGTMRPSRPLARSASRSRLGVPPRRSRSTADDAKSRARDSAMATGSFIPAVTPCTLRATIEIVTCPLGGPPTAVAFHGRRREIPGEGLGYGDRFVHTRRHTVHPSRHDRRRASTRAPSSMGKGACHAWPCPVVERTHCGSGSSRRGVLLGTQRVRVDCCQGSTRATPYRWPFSFVGFSPGAPASGPQLAEVERRMDILWFLPTHGDGRYLGTSEGARAVDLPYLRQIAQARSEEHTS